MTTGADAATNASAVAGGRFSTPTQLIKLKFDMCPAKNKSRYRIVHTRKNKTAEFNMNSV